MAEVVSRSAATDGAGPDDADAQVVVTLATQNDITTTVGPTVRMPNGRRILVALA